MRLPHAPTIGLLLLPLLTTGTETPYSDCGFTGSLVGLQLGSCREWPCVFERGVPIAGEVLFKAVSNYRTLKTTINALFGGIAIPLYVDEQMCTKLLIGQCPADIGESLSYLANLTVGHDLPTITVTLEWNIANGDGETVVCAQVPAQFH
ncbi:uncharacterized protein LOC122375288 [Amphibalanus amphitrite]|uniref:uncharacterized protein LOC122364968 n=1 Tax=Amphibalanus amphitrite TaxID=1232801 RepID=UPI001C90061E|nr:uncharacterized protein LOC122364968 [Amphibalanus amphitrite]XP_043210520.1 uncharacterized protein LOC122375288 [Amphibalanus amphitrite]